MKYQMNSTLISGILGYRGNNLDARALVNLTSTLKAFNKNIDIDIDFILLLRFNSDVLQIIEGLLSLFNESEITSGEQTKLFENLTQSQAPKVYADILYLLIKDAGFRRPREHLALFDHAASHRNLVLLKLSFKLLIVDAKCNATNNAVLFLNLAQHSAHGAIASIYVNLIKAGFNITEHPILFDKVTSELQTFLLAEGISELVANGFNASTHPNCFMNVVVNQNPQTLAIIYTQLVTFGFKEAEQPDLFDAVTSHPEIGHIYMAFFRLRQLSSDGFKPNADNNPSLFMNITKHKNPEAYSDIYYELIRAGFMPDNDPELFIKATSHQNIVLLVHTLNQYNDAGCKKEKHADLFPMILRHTDLPSLDEAVRIILSNQDPLGFRVNRNRIIQKPSLIIRAATLHHDPLKVANMWVELCRGTGPENSSLFPRRNAYLGFIEWLYVENGGDSALFADCRTGDDAITILKDSLFKALEQEPNSPETLENCACYRTCKMIMETDELTWLKDELVVLKDEITRQRH